MKKIYKSLLLFTTAGSMCLALASCGDSTRNSSVPYGTESKYNSTDVIATACNEEYNMTMSQFYSRLRYSGYSSVTSALKQAVYEKEYAAVKEVLTHESLDSVSEDTKKLITLTDAESGEALYSLSDTTLDYTKKRNNYEYIRNLMVEAISKSLASAIFSTSSWETVEGYITEDAAKGADEIKTMDYYYEKYVETEARLGITITAEDLKYKAPEDENSDVVGFEGFVSLVEQHEDLLKSYILTQAEQLSSKNALYQIADEEYIKAYNADEDDDPTKNSSYYLFDSDKLESTYDSTFKTYGTYRAMVIQFNSRRDAMLAMEACWDDAKTLDENYIALYNYCYPYEDTVTSTDDDRFTYKNTKSKNDLEDLPSDIQTLITDTLEDGDALIEPRDISDKYVMVYKLSSSYEIPDADDATKAKAYEDLTDEEKTYYDTIMKFDSITSSASGYATTNYKSILYKVMNNDTEDDDLKIYDPFFEQKYYNTYSEFYSYIDKADFKSDIIFSYNGIDYTTDQFYSDATKAYGTTVLENYFQLCYAYQFKEDYVDDDTHEDNEEALDSAIDTFNNGNNATYAKEFGLSNYLLTTYGYETKEDVLKYYYDAATCLSSYKAEKVFKAWATEDTTSTNEEDTDSSETVKYVMSDAAKEGILANILATGNKNYSTLFNINLDHILINIDADGDGTPDDPEEFLKDKSSEFRTSFEAAVTDLAQAIYKEAVSGNYGDNSLYTILSYIKTAYEEGAALTTDTTKTWDDYKKNYSFLLTVEELASSGDITQDSVSNFVTPFADYVKKVYEKVSEADIDMDDYTNGVFYIYNKADDTGTTLTNEDQASSITVNTLCSTVYGYHLLILNDYSGPDSTEYTRTDDDDYQINIPVLLYEDEDDDSNNIVVYVNAENASSDAANINQLFVYYVQKANDTTSSLDTDISSLMSTLFDDAITEYTSTNFQTYLLLSKINIQITADSVKVLAYDDKGLDVTYYANQVTDYGKNDEYESWVDSTTNWERPVVETTDSE